MGLGQALRLGLGLDLDPVGAPWRGMGILCDQRWAVCYRPGGHRARGGKLQQGERAGSAARMVERQRFAGVREACRHL